MEIHEIDWEALRAPFALSDIELRPLRTFDRNGQKTAEIAAYVDARAVAARLDAVVGPGGWAFDWVPVVTNAQHVMAAKGVLTICGVSKADVGDAGDTEPTKASVSDSLKRAAVLWGIGRYLYDLPKMYAKMDGKYMASGEEEKIRAKLPAPERPAPAPRAQAATSSTSRAPSSQSAPAPKVEPKPASASEAKSEANPRAMERTPGDAPAMETQLRSIEILCRALSKTPPDPEKLTNAAARALIVQLTNESRQRKASEASAAPAGAAMTTQEFIAALPANMTPRQAMDRLGVRTLSGVDLAKALDTLKTMREPEELAL